LTVKSSLPTGGRRFPSWLRIVVPPCRTAEEFGRFDCVFVAALLAEPLEAAPLGARARLRRWGDDGWPRHNPQAVVPADPVPAGQFGRSREQRRGCRAPTVSGWSENRAELASACGALHAWRVVGGPQPLPAIWCKHPAASIPVFVDDERTARKDRVLRDVGEWVRLPFCVWFLAALFYRAARVDRECHGRSIP
jgi:hypothetical protein